MKGFPGRKGLCKKKGKPYQNFCCKTFESRRKNARKTTKKGKKTKLEKRNRCTKRGRFESDLKNLGF